MCEWELLQKLCHLTTCEMLLDMTGKPSFAFIEDSENYFIVNVEDELIIESGSQKENPYHGEGPIKIFNLGDGPSKYLVSDGSLIWMSDHSELCFDLEAGCNGVGGWDEATLVHSIPSNATKCNNYEYFLKLNDWHGHNPDSICTLVAIQVIAGYYDTFLSDDFVPEVWDRVSYAYLTSSSCQNWWNWYQAPGTGYAGNEDPDVAVPHKADSRMRDYLVDYCINNVNAYVHSNGNNIFQQLDCLNHYISDCDVHPSCNLDWSEGNLADNWTSRTLNLLKSTIDSGRPIIVNGHHHSTVAFAYDDTYAYVHSGSGHVVRVPLYYYTDWDFTYSPTAIDLNPSGSHSHNNNFYSTLTNRFYCSCGADKGGDDIGLSNLVSITYDTGTILQQTISMPEGTANVSTKHARRNGSNILLDGSSEESYVELRLSETINGIMLNLDPDFLGPNVPNYEIDCMDSNGSWHTTFSLSEFTDLYYEREASLYLNLEDGTQGVRLKVNHNNSQPKLTLKKLVFAFC